MSFPVGTLLKTKKRFLTPNRCLLWAITGGTYSDFMVRLDSAVIYLGEWVAQSNVIGTFEMRHHFLTPMGVYGRDSDKFSWDVFERIPGSE
jgi:hypothetical protein